MKERTFCWRPHRIVSKALFRSLKQVWMLLGVYCKGNVNEFMRYLMAVFLHIIPPLLSIQFVKSVGSNVSKQIWLNKNICMSQNAVLIL